jgi:hypothetical protein
MRISKVPVVVAFSSLVLVSCQVAPIIHLINMSGHDIHVIVLDDKFPLAPLQVVEFAYPYSANGGMSIRYEQCIMTYMPPAPPKKGYTRYSGIREHFNVRLESDWSVTMMPPTESGLTGAPLEDQPKGFPLIPKRSGKCEQN